MIARRIVISGRVHGVGFREGVVRSAEAAGLVGWVRNVRNGTVEAFVQGEPAEVERLVAWCYRGPPAAQVTDVVVETRDADADLTAFSRRPTL